MTITRDINDKQFKLRESEESQSRLRKQNLSILLELNQKDQLLQRLKSEAEMNTRALKKFDEENRRLALGCQKLLVDCQNLEKEIALYEHDREVLMEFGNDADEREREALSRVLQLEQNLLLLVDELKKYNHHGHNLMADSSSTHTLGEKNLLDSFLETLTSTDDDSTYALLELNCENESCRKLLSMWNRINPTSRKVLSLVVKVKSLQKAKEHLTTNLLKAEEEVKLLFDDNSILDKANKRLLRQYLECDPPSSAGKHSCSASAKSNKRKSSPRTCSSPVVERKIDFGDQDSPRQPLSPLGINSPDCRIQKK